MTKNAAELLTEIETDLEGKVDVRRLRDIRDWLDDPAFLAELLSYIRTLNDPDSLNDIRSRIRHLWRLCEERCDQRKLDKEIILQMGVVGGVGLVTGSLIASASATFPFVVMVPIVGGAWMALQGHFGVRRLDAERLLYQQLAERAKQISDVVRDAR